MTHRTACHAPGPQNQVKLDPQGYVMVRPGTPKTSVQGVFAAGDVQDREWRQVYTSSVVLRSGEAEGGGGLSLFQAIFALLCIERFSSQNMKMTPRMAQRSSRRGRGAGAEGETSTKIVMDRVLFRVIHRRGRSCPRDSSLGDQRYEAFCSDERHQHSKSGFGLWCGGCDLALSNCRYYGFGTATVRSNTALCHVPRVLVACSCYGLKLYHVPAMRVLPACFLGDAWHFVRFVCDDLTQMDCNFRPGKGQAPDALRYRTEGRLVLKLRCHLAQQTRPSLPFALLYRRRMSGGHSGGQWVYGSLSGGAVPRR